MSVMISLRVQRTIQNQPIRTVRNAIHRLARLGDFLGPKHDSEPGWQNLWQVDRELELALCLEATLDGSGQC